MNYLGFFLAISGLFANGPLVNSHKKEALSGQSYIVKKLYSSDLSLEYYCYEYKDVGYEIIDKQNSTTIEFSPTSVSLYKDLNGPILTYDGPMCYGTIEKCDNSIMTTSSEEEELASDFNPVLTSFTSDYDTLIDNYTILSELSDFTRDTGGEYNNNDACGYLAAAMILYYSKYQYNSNFVSADYIEYKDGKRRFKASFYDYLVTIGQQIGKSNLTTAFDIKSVMEEYCKRISISANHYAMRFSTVANINMCINDNKPIALFGNLVSPSDGSKIQHAVACYGTRDEPLGGGSTNRYFIVNFGFHGCSRIYLLDNIFRNPVGSMYNMNY